MLQLAVLSALSLLRAPQPRRAIVERAIAAGALATTTTVSAPRRALAASAAPPGFEPAQLRGTSAAPPGFEPRRVEGVGDGFDVLAGPEIALADVVYPPFLNGTWRCERRVASVEGDQAQAAGAFRLLGGGGDFRQEETFTVRYLDTRQVGSPQAITGLDGRRYFGVVLDRAFELDARVQGAAITWDTKAPNTLTYQRDAGGRGSAAELSVVQRKVEQPSESNRGWGSNELIRITTDGGAVLGRITYCARVQRRWRRALTESNERVVEGVEIMKTYRVLDGIAGIEFPTSTTRSTIRLTRL
eukprot:1524434-Prymnesium_polylepis.1